MDLGGPAYADGAASADSIACLPLAEGFITTFRNLDLQRLKAELKQAKVTGEEDVTVASATFKAWKVEISSAAGEPGLLTLWIDQASRKVVKTTMTGPQLGGGSLTVELQK